MIHVHKRITAVTIRSDNRYGYATGTPRKNPTCFSRGQMKSRYNIDINLDRREIMKGNALVVTRAMQCKEIH